MLRKSAADVLSTGYNVADYAGNYKRAGRTSITSAAENQGYGVSKLVIAPAASLGYGLSKPSQITDSTLRTASDSAGGYGLSKKSVSSTNDATSAAAGSRTHAGPAQIASDTPLFVKQSPLQSSLPQVPQLTMEQWMAFFNQQTAAISSGAATGAAVAATAVPAVPAPVVCQCDPYCFAYGDCCSDYSTACGL